MEVFDSTIKAMMNNMVNGVKNNQLKSSTVYSESICDSILSGCQEVKSVSSGKSSQEKISANSQDFKHMLF